MYNLSQEKFLRLLCECIDQDRQGFCDKGLELELDALTEWVDIHPGYRSVGSMGGYYLISSEDLARIASIFPECIPDVSRFHRNDPT